jgi:hypothetical protein
MELKTRFGTFFMLIGFTLLVLFIVGDVLEVEELEAWYLLFGTVFAGFGIYLSVLGRQPPEESGRFRLLRRLASRGKKKQEQEEDEEDDSKKDE